MVEARERRSQGSGSPIALRAFTDHYADNSTEAGVLLLFHFNLCNEGYQSTFVPSTTFKKGKALGGFGKGARAATQTASHTGTEILGERFQAMNPRLPKGNEPVLGRTAR